CSGGIHYVDDETENTPSLLSTLPTSPSNSTAAQIFVIGTAESGPNVAPSTIYVFANDPTCNGGAPGTETGSGSADALNTSGIAVGYSANNSTNYFAFSVDSLGNTSVCSPK